MGYSNYKKIRTVVKRFNIDLIVQTLFVDVSKVTPSDWLNETLKRAEINLLTNEKAKSERLISPILLEVYQPYKTKISFFSGESLDVDNQADLAGPCDFFFSLHPPKPFIDAPIISLAEAKDDDMDWGVAQCAAQLYGAKIFNENEGKSINTLYGCATDGIEWQFIKLEENTFFIDTKIYTDLEEVLGVWHQIIKSYL
jgi:hypothetical protein